MARLLPRSCYKSIEKLLRSVRLQVSTLGADPCFHLCSSRGAGVAYS